MENISMKDVDGYNFLLCINRGRGTEVSLLKNTFCPPYKKPRLPFGGTSATVHNLLRPLKIAHTMLAEKIVQLEENPVAGYRLRNVLYNIERLYPSGTDLYQIGSKHYADDVQLPFLVDGFVLENSDLEPLSFSFDLTPFYPKCPDYPGYSTIDKSKISIEPLKWAADCYNEYVSRLFDKGFFVIPAGYVVRPDINLPREGKYLEI